MSGPIVVVGDVLLDRDIDGVVERLCPDAPVPVLAESATVQRPGGAALAATFLALDGADVVLVGAVGDDEAGDTVRRLLADIGVTLVELPYDGPTPEKIRLRAGSHMLLRLDRGTAPGRIDGPPAEAAAALQAAAAVLVSDYGRGLTALAPLRRWLTRVAGRTPVVWDPHPKGSTPVPGAHLVCPNRAEAAGFVAVHGVAVTGSVGDDIAEIAAEATLLRGAWHVGAVAITIGARGAVLGTDDGPPLHVAAAPCRSGDTCGAGDRFSATATLGLARGSATLHCVRTAVQAATGYVAGNGPDVLQREPSLEGTNR
jgi:D-beta-D-heptose 7-phosphate kinase/D-beta-D-heptose 1-phosphate adenosyltransferase